jgi:phage shock protein C
MKRDMSRANLCGVCAGLGKHFNIDPFWIRAAFVIAFLHFGIGLLLYIILALMIEKE